ncbi:MAG: 3'-5' exonuclease [Elusimicrobia bacterium]|nr:3'-5' exonuclease [Elusimicrobiota bacterium]
MKLFFADTETTGLDPVRNEAFQLAFIIEVDGKVVCEKNIKLRPVRPETADAKALEVTQKTLKELAGYPPRADGFKELTETLAQYVDRYDKNDKLTWVGQNPEFDVRFVRQLFKEHGDNYFGSWFDSRPADLISLAVASRVKGLINPENFKLGTLAAQFGIKFDAHDALEDVRVTREVWARLSAFLQPVKGTAVPVQADLFDILKDQKA